MALLRALLLMLSLAAATAAAEERRGRDAALDALFHDLAIAPSAEAAREIEAEIRSIWFEAPDERSAFLMEVALERRFGADRAGAVYALDELIRNYPDYAEAWNQRASVLYSQGNLDQALRDIEETLAREPRHFPALAGKATIHLRRGEIKAAQEALIAATRINPWLAERRHLDPALIERRL